MAYRIGLTGNIATGKSTVARLLAELGAEVWDGDRIAHEVMAPGGPAYPAVVAAFGPGILDAAGAIDRRALGAIVFADPTALARLETLVHPAVMAEVARRQAASTAPVVVVEAIKLLEAGGAATCQTIWVTTCPPEVQVARLVHYRNLTPEEAWQRVNAQPPPAAKLARADVIIDTGGTLEATRQQVLAAWAQLPLSK